MKQGDDNSEAHQLLRGSQTAESIQEVVAMLHRTVSQQTKEIAVLNQFVSSVVTAKVDEGVRGEVQNLFSQTTAKIDKLSTSLHQLTREIFQNKCLSAPDTDSIGIHTPRHPPYGDYLSMIEALQKRIENLERNKTPQLSQTRAISLVDIPPTETKSMIEDLKTEIARIQKMPSLQITRLAKDIDQEFAEIHKQMTLYARKEDLRNAIQEIHKQFGMQNSRPGTPALTHDRTPVSQPRCYYQVINGESLRRPATTQDGRGYIIVSSKRGRRSNRR